MSELTEQILSEAAISDRPGGYYRLERIAADVAALERRVAGLEALIERVRKAAQEGLADCDDDCDMSSLWVLETLSISGTEAMEEAKADAWSEGAAAVLDFRISGDRYVSIVRNPLPDNPYRKAGESNG